MASAEQPLKKRKIYEQQQLHEQRQEEETPLPPQPPPPPPPAPPPQPPPAPLLQQKPLTQEEIHRRRRNCEEIRSVYECYKRIKNCISTRQHDEPPRRDGMRHQQDLEQAYLSLITASRGCMGVQRLVADLIPRYAQHCPTALEAAAKVVISMHNSSLQVIARGEDFDGVAFETAQSCIFGLAEICRSASTAAPTSSVIQGICSAVFLNVLSFFVSSFEGKNILETVDKEIFRIQDATDFISEFKQRTRDDEDSASRLSNLRALTFLRILFCCPKNSIASCFEYFDSTATEDSHKVGYFFLRLITSELSTYALSNESDDAAQSADFAGTIHDGKGNKDECAPNGDNISQNASPVLKNCLIRLILGTDASLKSWIFSRYRILCKSASSQVLSDVASSLEGIFASFTEQVKAEESRGNGSGRDFTSVVHDVSSPGKAAERYGSTHVKNSSSAVPPVTDYHSNVLPTGGGSRSVSVESMEPADLPYQRSSTPRKLLNQQPFSPISKRTPDFRSNSFDRNFITQMEQNQVSRIEASSPGVRSLSGSAKFPFESPSHHVPVSLPPPSQSYWYSDGDSAAMNIISASKQLWLGSLGPDASEALVRNQFEKFGPIDNFLYIPTKGFALIEYRNIMDALKAREIMQKTSPWGACLQIKFLDAGLGTRGAVNGAAVGSSCHVYVGNVSSPWVKDEILHECRKVVYKGPRATADLTTEAALLVEFNTPEEAGIAMTHLRQHRKESKPHLPSSLGSANIMTNCDGMRPSSAALHVDSRSSYSKNNMIGSPHGQTVLESSTDGYAAKMSRNTGKHHAPPVKTDGNSLELNSPRINQDNYGMMGHNKHAFQPNWTAGHKGMHEVGARSTENMVVDSSGGGGHVSSCTEQMWMHRKPETEFHSGPRRIPCPPIPPQGVPMPSQGPPIPGQGPPIPTRGLVMAQVVQTPPPIRPVYFPSNSSWDVRGVTSHLPPNPVPPMPSNFPRTAVAPPFLPASVTPLAQIQGSSIRSFDPMFPLSAIPPPLTSLPPPQPNFGQPLPPQPDMQPLPPTPPPPPYSQPPVVPPPPSSPPPHPPSESVDSEGSGQIQHFPWQGALSKSGIHYCTIHAQRADSDVCKYSNEISEPAEWPAKLDMTKRTDFRHVKTTFSNTPPHKREICWLLPSSHADHKGFQDFISYLKQRECAGVIKIPAVKSMWARLLFILPYSLETCSLLSLAPNPSLCLIGLILPKETNFEWV